jgi:hypothetical protein
MIATAASEKQITFIKKLAEERNIVLNNTGTEFSKKAASEMIEKLLATPKPASAKKSTAIEDGFYELEGKVYKVVTSPNSGNKYAKVFTELGFEYAQGATSKLAKAGIKLTLEAAKNYGHLYGMCVICGRVLTDEISISQGIGPVCAGKL